MLAEPRTIVRVTVGVKVGATVRARVRVCVTDRKRGGVSPSPSAQLRPPIRVHVASR